MNNVAYNSSQAKVVENAPEKRFLARLSTTLESQFAILSLDSTLARKNTTPIHAFTKIKK